VRFRFWERILSFCVRHERLSRFWVTRRLVFAITKSGMRLFLFIILPSVALTFDVFLLIISPD